MLCRGYMFFFFFSSRRRHTRFDCDWSSDVCSSDLVPQRRRLGEVGLAPCQVAQEGALGDGPRAVVNGPVHRGPVHRQAQPPPHLLERLFVQVGEPLAEFDEVSPGDGHLLTAVAGRRGELRIVGQRRLAPHVVVVLHPALGRQPVVVPPDRVEHRLAAHPLIPRDDVGVAERADVPDVQSPADGQRGCVDRVDLAARRGAVKLVLRPRLPTGETTCPRCRQAKACPAPGCRWGGIRYSFAQGSVRPPRLKRGYSRVQCGRRNILPRRSCSESPISSRELTLYTAAPSGGGRLAASASSRLHRTFLMVIIST